MRNQPSSTHTITATIATIYHKTDNCLLADTRALVATEKKTQVELIMHLAELAERKLHLDHGYASMFDYCQRALHLAEGEIWLRLQVSSCCRSYPEVLAELAAGSINLTIAGKISAHLNEENKTKLLGFCCGKTVREVEEYLSRLKPRAAQPSSLRKCRAPQQVPTAPTNHEDTEVRLPGERELLELSVRHTPSRCEAVAEDCYQLRCTISADQRRKLERLAEIIGIDSPLQHLSELLEKAVEIALKAKDPSRPRRTKKSEPTSKAQPVPQANQNQCLPAAPRAPRHSRTIPAAIRRAVFQRDQFQCQFRAPDGGCCPQRTHLCIDHIVPFAQGGSHEINNLQLLCASHNLRKMERDFGWSWRKSEAQKSA